MVPYGRSAADTAEFHYDNDTVYFAQPSLSQFLPGGSGAGTFDPDQLMSLGLHNIQNDAVGNTGRDAPKTKTSVVLRYVPSAC